MSATPADVIILTYGTLHDAHVPVRPDVAVDLTTALRNPHHDPQMRQRTGLNADVRDHVLATPGAEAIITDTLTRIHTTLTDHTPVLVHIYCKGGRHRSVAIAEEIHNRLDVNNVRATVTHRDIRKPVVPTR